MKAITVGSRVEIVEMANSSFYKRVKGIVTEIRNGYVYVEADEVMSKWDNKYKKHPGTCATAGKIENVILL